MDGPRRVAVLGDDEGQAVRNVLRAPVGRNLTVAVVEMTVRSGNRRVVTCSGEVSFTSE